MEDELTQSLQCALDGDNAMTQRHTNITQYGTVGKVALQTANRELLSQELKYGISNAQVTLTVLVVDRVHLVWHGTRTNLTSLDLLLEVIHRDIHPEVTVQVDDDGVDTADGIKDSTQMIIVANLSSILLALQTQLLADKLVAKAPSSRTEDKLHGEHCNCR